MKKLLFILLILSSSALAQRAGNTPDLFLMGEMKRGDVTNNNLGNNNTSGRTPQVVTLNTAVKNLVVITDGQSNSASNGPSYVPVNVANIVNINPYDGAVYPNLDPLLGTATILGTGSFWPRIADMLITAGKFAKVWIIPIGVGGSSSIEWTPGGQLFDKPCVAMRRLQQLGITPSTTNFTIIYTFNQGESDSATSAATYTNNINVLNTRLRNCPGVSVQFNGRFFIARETMLFNVVNPIISNAQFALTNGVTIFDFGDMDSITGAANRPDGTHLSTAAGQAAYATLAYNALVASGAPF